jgi:hypothetical protein
LEKNFEKTKRWEFVQLVERGKWPVPQVLTIEDPKLMEET